MDIKDKDFAFEQIALLESMLEELKEDIEKDNLDHAQDTIADIQGYAEQLEWVIDDNVL